MRRWARLLGAVGEVVPLDYPYALAGRRSPDRLPVLVAAHRAALAQARARHPGRAVLVGKSMGSRIGCHLALEEPVAALVCLGYPLRGARGDLRSEVLLALRTPILFVQGSRDALCPLDALEQVRGRMTATSALHVVEQLRRAADDEGARGGRVLPVAGPDREPARDEILGDRVDLRAMQREFGRNRVAPRTTARRARAAFQP